MEGIIPLMSNESKRPRESESSTEITNQNPETIHFDSATEIPSDDPWGGLSEERHTLLIRIAEEIIPYNKFLGLKVESLKKGYCVIRIPWQDQLIGDPSRPALHGGVTSCIADVAGGFSCFALLENPTDAVSTIDLRVDYLRPGKMKDIFCEGKVERMGNRVAQTRMSVYSGANPAHGTPEDKHLIAMAHGVYNVVRRK